MSLEPDPETKQVNCS